MKIIVIDPRRSRTAQSADWHIPIRIGTDAALAIGIMHMLVRDGHVRRAYLAATRSASSSGEREVLPQFTPARVAEITGLAVDRRREARRDVRRGARRSFIRMGEGMTRLARGGQALRAVAMLPALTGAYGRRGGGALLLTAGSMDFNFARRAQALGPGADAQVNHRTLGEALLNMSDPPLRAC